MRGMGNSCTTLRLWEARVSKSRPLAPDLDSGMAGLLDLLGEAACDEIALDAQSTRDDQRILGGR